MAPPNGTTAAVAKLPSVEKVLEPSPAAQLRKSVFGHAGITIGALLRHVVAHGLWFPVLPGHPEISVGGCAAFNTHGKTQHDILSYLLDRCRDIHFLLPDFSFRCSWTRLSRVTTC